MEATEQLLCTLSCCKHVIGTFNVPFIDSQAPFTPLFTPMLYCNVTHIIHSLFDHTSKLTVGRRAHLPLCQLLARVVRSFPLSDALAAQWLSTGARDSGVVRARAHAPMAPTDGATLFAVV